MNREYIEEWLNNLKKYWLEKDIKNATNLFRYTTYYQETPFIKPYTTFKEIKEEWQHIKEENIQNIEINILAIENNTVIAEWLLKQNNINYSGIYHLKFNQNKDCIYFKSWEMND